MDNLYLFLTTASVICVSLALVFFIVLRRLATRERTLPLTPDWINDLSVDRYRPMLRLLDEEDLGFLAAQSNFDRKKLGKIRAERCAIFRGYLRSLSADFSRICTAIEVLLLQSQRDRPDLAALLLKQKAHFTLAVIAVNFRLVLYRWGLGSVDVGALVGVFDSMRLELRQLVPAVSEG